MQAIGIQTGPTGLVVAVSGALNLNSYDPRDTNRDGKVSSSEDLANTLKRPEVVAIKQLQTRGGLLNASALDFTYRDPRDVNHDGVVSSAEARAYALLHPDMNPMKGMTISAKPTSPHAIASATVHSYSAKGTVSSTLRSTHGSIDMEA